MLYKTLHIILQHIIFILNVIFYLLNWLSLLDAFIKRLKYLIKLKF